MSDIAAIGAAALLLAAAAVHLWWAAGRVWPAPDAGTLARAVVGPTQQAMPGAGPCAAVAALLVVAAAVMTVRAGLVGWPGPAWVVTLGTWAVVGVLLLRGGIGLVTSLAAGRAATYHRLDVAVYSPLCLAIALLCLPAALG